MSIFINLPSDITRVDSTPSSVSTNPLQNKAVVEAIDSLFQCVNHNIVEQGIMDTDQFAIVQKKQPIEINNKMYYCSSEDNDNYYYFTNYRDGTSIHSNIVIIEKAHRIVSFLDANAGQYSDQIVFSTYHEFPNVGQENVLYIDKEENVSYLWNPLTYTYDGIIIESNEYTIQSIL